MSTSRQERAANLERWAEEVEANDLQLADTEALRHIAELAEQRRTVEDELNAAVLAARQANRPWSEIGAMLGVSKQAAQRKYGNKTVA